MRKFLLFLLLLPLIVILGHDTYMFSQNSEKGFLLSDTGALWAKYHKKSHDKWKINLGKLGEVVDDLGITNISKQPNLINEQQIKDTNSYEGGFMQSDKKGEERQVLSLKKENSLQANTTKLQKIVGFILEQKALFIFTIFAGVILLIYGIIRLLLRTCLKFN